MGRYSAGKYSRAVSDRSGQVFPYREMVREWNGSLVHRSEYEEKHPQLDLRSPGADAQALRNPRAARIEPLTVFVGSVVFPYNYGSENRLQGIGCVGTVSVSTS